MCVFGLVFGGGLFELDLELGLFFARNVGGF